MELNKRQIIVLGIATLLISTTIMAVFIRKIPQVVEEIEQEQEKTEVEQFMERLEQFKIEQERERLELEKFREEQTLDERYNNAYFLE